MGTDNPIPPPTPEAPDYEQDLSSNETELEELIRFVPEFQKDEEAPTGEQDIEAAKAAAVDSTKEADPAEVAASPPPVPAAGAEGGLSGSPAAPAAPALPPPIDPQIAMMAEQIRQLQQQNANLTARQMQPAAAAAPAAPAAPAFNFSVPPKVIEDMLSEDGAIRQQAVSWLVNQTAEAAYRKAVEEVRRETQQYVQQYVGSAKQVDNSQAEIARDFYGTFPELNQRELYPVIVSVAQEVMQESGMQSWSPALKNEIGRRVKAIAVHLGTVVGTPAPSATPANGAAPVAVPPPQKLPRIGSANRARPALGAPSSGDIGDMLGM